jgi:hypothetical protein
MDKRKFKKRNHGFLGGLVIAGAEAIVYASEDAGNPFLRVSHLLSA